MSDERKVRLLCFDISAVGRPLQLVLLSCGVFCFHVLSSYFMEKVFKTPGITPFAWYFVLIQLSLMTGLALIQSKILNKDGPRKIPLPMYAQLAAFYCAGFGLGNAALAFINFPTQVIFKCCKLVPVLIGGFFIQGKQVTVSQLVAAVFMSIGLATFMLADSMVSPVFNLTGYIMISLSVVGDALVGNYQEKALKTYQASSAEMLVYSQSIAAVYVLCFLLASGNLFSSISFYNMHAVDTYLQIAICSLFSYAGLSIVLTLVKEFGAFVAATVTTMRKAVTITLSFIIFPKPFTIWYVWSAGLIFFGVFLYDLGSQGLLLVSRRFRQIMPSSVKLLPVHFHGATLEPPQPSSDTSPLGHSGSLARLHNVPSGGAGENGAVSGGNGALREPSIKNIC